MPNSPERGFLEPLINTHQLIMSRLGNYLRDTATEMKHVSWPTQSQAMVYTALVILVSAIVALLLGGFDYLFTNLLDKVIFSF